MIPIVVTFESSGKWPDNYKAIESIKTAFYIRIAQSLRTRYDTQSIVSKNYLDVLLNGFCFRVKIFYPREIFVRKAQSMFYSKSSFRTPVSRNILQLSFFSLQMIRNGTKFQKNYHTYQFIQLQFQQFHNVSIIFHQLYGL